MFKAHKATQTDGLEATGTVRSEGSGVVSSAAVFESIVDEQRGFVTKPIIVMPDNDCRIDGRQAPRNYEEWFELASQQRTSQQSFQTPDHCLMSKQESRRRFGNLIDELTWPKPEEDDDDNDVNFLIPVADYPPYQCNYCLIGHESEERERERERESRASRGRSRDSDL